MMSSSYAEEIDFLRSSQATTFGRSVIATADAAALNTLTGAATVAQVAAGYQPLDGTLTAFAGLTVASDKLPYATGADAFATTTLTSFARTFLDDADASTVRTTLGLGTVAVTAPQSSLTILSGKLGRSDTLYDDIAGKHALHDSNFDLVQDMLLDRAAALIGDGHTLSCPYSSLFDIATSSKFSFVGWINPLWSQGITGAGALGLDQSYFANWDDSVSNKCAFAIRSGGSTNEGESLRITMARASNGSAATSATTPYLNTNTSQNSMIGVTYDGTQSTGSDRPRLYLDGVDPGHANYSWSDHGVAADGDYMPGTSGSGGNVIAATAGTIKIGTLGAAFHGYAVSRLSAFWFYKNRILTPTEMATFYAIKGGRPVYWRDLLDYNRKNPSTAIATTGLVCMLNLDEVSGRRNDSSGNGTNFSEQGGTVSGHTLISQYKEGGKFGRTMYPIKGTASDGGNLVYSKPYAFCNAPRLVENRVNGHNAMLVDDWHNLYTPAGAVFNGTSIDYFGVEEMVVAPTGETFSLCTAGEGDGHSYWIWGISTAYSGITPWQRMSEPSINNNGTLVGTGAAWNTGEKHLYNWRCLGSGGITSMELWEGTSQSTFEWGLANNDTTFYNTVPDSMLTHQNVGINCLPRDTGTDLPGGSRYIYRQLVYDGLDSTTAGNIRTQLKADYSTL